MTSTDTSAPPPAATPFMGLAPFLRMSIAGTDLRPIAQELLASAESGTADINQWMNLSIALLCLEQREVGLAVQNDALSLQRVYHLPAAQQPAKLRLLMLMVPGDLAANTPLECLLENSDIDLIFYYLTHGDPLAAPVPEHDAVIVAVSEGDENRALLTSLEQELAAWPKPVINRPQFLPNVGRAKASELLQGIPGLVMPPTLRASRLALQAIAAGINPLAQRFPGCDFPVILRPLGSHAGRDLDRIDDRQAMAAYLARIEGKEFYLSPFIDYRGADGQFRKMRVALVDGAPYACHMAVSSHWMVHYVNAGMYEEAHKREEEARFMETFADFAQRHRPALEAIHQRTGLDYLCIDCAETPDGQLLIFEIDHAMVVHAMDTEQLFPYKQTHMLKVKDAFRDYLLRLTAA